MTTDATPTEEDLLDDIGHDFAILESARLGWRSRRRTDRGRDCHDRAIHDPPFRELVGHQRDQPTAPGRNDVRRFGIGDSDQSRRAGDRAKDHGRTDQDVRTEHPAPVPVVTVPANVLDSHDRTARGRHREREETQSCRPAAKGMSGHHRAARENEQQQHGDLSPTQSTVPITMAATNSFAQEDQPVEQYNRSGNDMHVERRPVKAGKRGYATLQEEGIEIGREVIGIVRQDRG